ncbi:hypothetical protein CLV36_103160 [Laceyella sediminis]|uniref:Activator of Hsp90 ATPase-like protein n=1 Tax=Laceyella sediminis TaxID=573074 RepID=A0ABX5EQZ2_9BACL|nr:hypothetical protein [Laceyella sediminis]PRZ15934.1 hypothetical protein CLV36_103160 [Laceyella sediminis]
MMKCKSRKTNQWLLKINRDPYIENPNWDLIQNSLSEMDGQRLSMVLLRRKAKGEIIIHGGNFSEGKKIYYVNYWYEITDQLFQEEEEMGIEELYPYDMHFELVDDTKTEEKECQITISQLTVMPENVCVCWNLMIKAVKHFFDHDGELHPTLNWREFEMF